MKRRKFLVNSLMAAVASPGLLAAQPKEETDASTTADDGVLTSAKFVHPGIFQRRADLDLMKAKIRAGEEPWIGKWNRLLERSFSSLSFRPAPVAHLVREAGGVEKTGDDELRASVDGAGSHVLQWYVTGDVAHAEKVAEILDAWAQTLWDFNGNDGKLTAGWTGASLCNSAEILRATYPAWGAAREQRFRKLLLDVYLPIEQDMFPEANGNWDGAIMHTLAAIAVFTEDRTLLERVISHYQCGTGNGGIAKYVYPSGQCSESTRDMGHTQLGLGHFALTAHICGNQGADLFRLADDRLALGFEYTSKYMLGEAVPCFGDISVVGRGRFSDFYEAVYQHYRYVRGLRMPYTEKALLRAREHAASTLIFYRGETSDTPRALLPAPQIPTDPLFGARFEVAPSPAGAMRIKPGEDLQEAMDVLAQKGGGTIYLEPGIHSLEQPLRVASGVTMAGAGRSTILSLASRAKGYCIISSAPDLHDVSFRDFVLEGATTATPSVDPNQDRRMRSLFTAPARGGIRLSGERLDALQRIGFARLTVRNCTMSGVELEGASRISIEDCDFSESGADIVPGAGQHHNLRVHFCSQVILRRVRLDGSLAGCGLSARATKTISAEGCEAARNRASGLRFYNCEEVTVMDSILEANDGFGIEHIPDSRRSMLSRQLGNISRCNGGDAAPCLRLPQK